jgi:hypothetical protein
MNIDEPRIDEAAQVAERGFAALGVEFLLYLSIILRAFGWQLGIMNFQGLSGGIVVFSGLACLTIMLANRERLPLSFWFILLINVLAGVSEFFATTDEFLASTGPKNMLYWLSWTLMICYVARNDRAYVRFAFFLSFCVFVALAVGMHVRGTGFHSRVTLEGQNIATMFANSNELAQVSVATAIALLFYSLRSNSMVAAMCVAAALGLAVVTLRTVSREGLILLSFGIFLYFIDVVLKRKGKTGFVIMILLALLGVYKFSHEYQNIKKSYAYRLEKPSERTNYFATALQDMGDTIILGKGTAKPFTSQGITPHNTLLWTHIVYGGLCAWTYVMWIIVICWKTVRRNVFQRSQADKNELLAMMFIFLAAQQVSPFASSNFGIMLALAVLEKSLWMSRPEPSQPSDYPQLPGYGNAAI